jgi:hypothetical protein
LQEQKRQIANKFHIQELHHSTTPEKLLAKSTFSRKIIVLIQVILGHAVA